MDAAGEVIRLLLPMNVSVVSFDFAGSGISEGDVRPFLSFALLLLFLSLIFFSMFRWDTLRRKILKRL